MLRDRLAVDVEMPRHDDAPVVLARDRVARPRGDTTREDAVAEDTREGVRERTRISGWDEQSIVFIRDDGAVAGDV